MKETKVTIVNEIEREITYTCPKRGKVTEKVKVKVYPTGGTPPNQTCH